MLMSASVSVSVYNDPNQSTAPGTGPVAGRQVFIDLNGDGVFEVGEPTAITGSAGTATLSLAGISGTTCQVGEILPEGIGQTLPTSSEATVTIASPTAVAFGNITLTGSALTTGTDYTKFAFSNLPSNGYVTQAVTQPDGKLVIAGYTIGFDFRDEAAFLARYFPDGEPDEHFGTNGIADASGGKSDSDIAGLTIEPNGDIAVLDRANLGAFDNAAVYTVLFSPDGSLINGSGWQSNLLNMDPNLPNALAAMPDGSLLVSGSGGTGQDDGFISLVNVSASTNQAITSFGTGGTATYSVPAGRLDGAAVVNPTGGFDVIADNGDNTSTLLRFSDTGAMQLAVSLPPTSAGVYPTDFQIQPDGKLLLFGSSGTVASVARVKPDGTLDTTFGTNHTGITSEDLSREMPSGATAVYVDDTSLSADGSLLVSGEFDGINPDTSAYIHQCFVQQYGSGGSITLGGNGAPLIIAGESDTSAQLGAPLAKLSGVLPVVTAGSSSQIGFANPAFVNGSVGFSVPTSSRPRITTGQGVANLNVESTSPTATWQTPSPNAITAVNTSPEILQVEYKDAVAVDLHTLGSGNLQVMLPGGATENPTFIGVEKTGSNQDLFADYSLPAPAGGWTTANNGPYSIKLLANQVSNAVHAAPAATLGAFNVSIAAAVNDTTPPTAVLAPVSAVTSAGTAPLLLSVTYTDNIAVKLLSIDTADLTVNGPGGTPLTVNSANTTAFADASSITVTYTVAAPPGGWVAADNGTYPITLLANAVTDTSNNPAATATLGNFVVAVGIPAGTLAAVPDVTSTGVASLALVVTYTDTTAPIKLSSIGNANLTITAPSGGNLSVTGSAADESMANQLVVTYTVAAPAGGFQSADNGTYTVALAANEITDTSSATALPATLGTFVVDIPAAIVTQTSSTVTLTIPVTTIQSGNLALFTANVTGTDGGTPTGTITFSQNAIVIGTATLTAGSASFSTANLSSGSDVITAAYSGDTAYIASTSLPQTITVTAAPAGAAALTPSVTTAVLPPTLVAGAKHKLAIPVTISNTGGQISSGLAQIVLYASLDGSLDTNDMLLTTLRHSLKLKANKSAKLVVHLNGLPVSLAAGTYHLLVHVIDAAGFAQTAGTSAAITVAAPAISPVVSFAKVTVPTSIIAGKKARGVLLINITNNGNVAITGPVSIMLYLTADGTATDGTIIKTLTVKLSIPAGKSKKISAAPGLIPLLAAGAYQFAAVVKTPAANGAAANTNTVVDSATVQVLANGG